MNYNPRILAGLDLSALDAFILQSIKLFFETSRLECLYLLHISAELEIPEKIKSEFFHKDLPADEALRDILLDLAKKHFNADERRLIKLEVRDGNPGKDLLKWSRIKHIDVMVLGRKNKSGNPGSLVRKMVNIADCSLLLIPQITPKKIEKIYVAVDFSKISLLALEKAIELSEATGAQITCHHIYHVPSGYHKTGKTYDEFAEVMKKHAEKEAEKVLKQKGSKNLHFEYSPDHEGNPAKVIESFARDLACDAVFIGSKGRTAAASLLLGSVAERCIEYIKDIPLFVVKKKGENLGFIDALLKI